MMLTVAPPAVITLLTTALLFALGIALFMALSAQRRLTRENAALRGRERDALSLCDRAPVPLHAIRPDGTIEQVSSAWLELLGYDREEVIGQPITAFLEADSASRWLETDSAAVASGAPLRAVPYRLRRKSGEVAEVLLSVTPERDEAGRFSRAVAATVDITERKRAEDAALQGQKLAIVGQLSGGIANDFNNMLMVVTGNLEAALRAVQTGLFVKGQRHVEAALAGANGAAQLIQRLMSFSRPPAVPPRVLDVNQSVRAMSDLLSRNLGGSIAIDLEPGDGVWPIRADAGQFETAVLNLVMNAREAGPGDGIVRITTRNLAAPEAAAASARLAPGDYVAISVTDRGRGMPPDVAEKAFEPFFTTKESGNGAGIGLSMVLAFARGAGGDATLQSAAGLGTTASIYLPRSHSDVIELSLPQARWAPEPVRRDQREFASTRH